MSTIHVHPTTTLSPERFAAGPTEVGPGRSEALGKGADAGLEVNGGSSR